MGQYGVAETGLMAGWHFDDGNSEQTPMGMKSAIDGAKPGDLFWLLEGTYTGDFTNSRSGTAEYPIVYRNRIGHHALIYGAFNVQGSNVWIWGLELTDPNKAANGNSIIGLYAPGVHVINNIIHHGFDKNGIGAWNTRAGQ